MDWRKRAVGRATAGPVKHIAIMPCAVALLGMMILACHMASAGPWDTVPPRPGNVRQTDMTPVNVAKPPADAEARPAGDLILSPAAQRVSQIAGRNGDRRFILVDKAHGKIFLFQNGRPAFGRSALTGESTADMLPPDAMYKPVSQHIGVKYKVTPAGRFTLTRAHDDALGETFDINELQGTDWTIAIHQVWLGIRSQHRDARLRSTDDQDKHITEGCIDVDPSTIEQLSRFLPNADGTAIYILPTDESLITALFEPRGSVTATAAPTGRMNLQRIFGGAEPAALGSTRD